MAVITILLGGLVGMLSGIVALITGQGFLSAMLIWSGAGMIIPLLIVLIGRMPRRDLVKIRA